MEENPNKRMLVAVGSGNPLKLKAVRTVLRRAFPRARSRAVEARSGVSRNPLSNRETIAGARRRAKEARKQAGADWGIGLEGGLARIAGRWFTCVWCVIWDGRRETLGGCVHFELPPAVLRGILRERKELGTCMDELTGVSLTKRKMGAEGILTAGMVDRRKTFQNTIIYALAPRLSPKHYGEGEGKVSSKR